MFIMAFEEMGQVVEKELGWDDTIEKESSFILLPDGDYEFTVTEFLRARHEGSENLPPCNKAILTINIKTKQGESNIKHNLFLHSRTEGMVSAFFLGIGLKKHGEPFKMNWNNVIGSKGICKVSTRLYDGKQYNDIKRFYDPEKDKNINVCNPSAPAKAFKPGAF